MSHAPSLGLLCTEARRGEPRCSGEGRPDKMGSATSSEEGEQSLLTSVHGGEESSIGDERLTDFSSLFQPEQLYKALLAIKEPPGGAISRSKEGMIHWLSSLVDNDELSVNVVQVVEHLTGKGVSREEALEFFSEIDRDGEGHIDIAHLLMVLKDQEVDPMQAFIPCHLKPGPLEVFLPESHCQSNTGHKLVQFLQGRRLKPNSLVVGPMSQIMAYQMTREKLVQGRHHMFVQREAEDDLMVEEGRGDGHITERVVVSKCYSKIEASSSQHQIKNLTDDRMDTYWQSSGSPRSHWIRLRMLPGMAVRELAVSVQSSDDSYMPRTVVVSVGNSNQRMMEIKTVNIPRDRTGPVVLLKNLSQVYQCVQVNIRACHSDGCDCKVRGLHVKGSKAIKEDMKQPTVLDTVVMWYIKLLASTAEAALPVAPQLKRSLIAHSRTAVSSLEPLVLSPTSPVKPEFLTPFVVEEMQLMLQSFCSSEDGGSVSAESLEVLLAFSISCGNVNSILDSLHTLLDYQCSDLNMHSLLHKMETVVKNKYHIHSEAMELSLVTCSVPSKDDDHKFENILTIDISSPPSNPYVSVNGHTTAAVVLRQKDGLFMFPTRLVLQVPSADNAASICLVFLLETEPGPGWLESLEGHRGWDKERWLQHVRAEEEKSGLIARLEFSKELPQVDVALDVATSGRCLVVAMRATGEDVETVALQMLCVFGHCLGSEEETSPHLEMNSLAPLQSENGMVSGRVILSRILLFLLSLLQDLAKLTHRHRLASLESSMILEPHLGVEGLSLQKIWKLYLLLSSKTEHADLALLVLRLLKLALPFIKPEQASREGATRNGPSSSAILSYLSTLLDKECEQQLPAVKRLAEEIVVKGVAIFFPDSVARRTHLLEMIGSVLSESQPRSWWLQFEALCHYFSTSDANSLLGLPSMFKEGEPIATGKALELMVTMLAVARRESEMSLSSDKARPPNLVSLLCALQASLFFWCRKNIINTDAQELLMKYVDKLVTSSIILLKVISAIESGEVEAKIAVLQDSLLTRTLAEMLVFLPTLTKSCLPLLKLMDCLFPLVAALQTVVSMFPSLPYRLNNVTVAEEEESVVGVWTRESPHNYENNARVTEEFVCPSATRFVVEFDSRCLTERRYDYLEFTDVSGVKKRFDGKFNTERWPQTAEFPGPRLQFLFHSDGSNNEWGYLFTLKAYGQAAPSLHWLLDLQLSLARLLGQFTSTTLSMKRFYTKPLGEREEEQRDEALLTGSDLWRTLFRGGYMLRKLTRSLSGAHTASPAISELNSLLHDMAAGEEGKGRELLTRLRETEKGPYYGGERVDRAVSAVFAALIWHCQELREELATQPVLSDQPSKLLREAFLTAEALRRELAETRQKLLEAKEKSEEKGTEMNEDSPLISCYNKALFLLKFAGLSRVDQEGGAEGQEAGSAVSTVGRLKQQLSLGGLTKLHRKPASFDLVLSFVKNEAITEKKVHHLLQEREKLASCVTQGYTFAANYLSALSTENMFELPGLVFLQQLLSQQSHFPVHYAAKLDGCGLELENQVRKAYRLLIKHLLEGLVAFSQPPSIEYQRAKLLVSIVTCHLLDMQWQSYDHLLLADLQISDFLLQSAISSTHTDHRRKVEKFHGEEAMLARYELHMSLLEKDNELGGEDFAGLQNVQLYKENKWEADLFVEAKRWPPDAGVGIQCDSCQTVIRDTFYHNMELKTESFDLCTRCFQSGTGSRPDNHTADQLYLVMGAYFCSHCSLCIMSHRFHCSTRDNADLCLGCFRKEEAKGNTGRWTVYLSTQVPAIGTANPYMTSDPVASKPLIYENGWLTRTGDSVELMVYQQQHCWLLFSSLCLTMAHCLNHNQSGGHGKSYQEQACHNLLQCLRQLTRIVQRAVVAKEEEVKECDVQKEKSSASELEGCVSEIVRLSEGDDVAGTTLQAAVGDDPVASASLKNNQDDLKLTLAEKTFSLLFLTPSLYTLAAVLSANMSDGWWKISDEVHRTVLEELLPALVSVIDSTAIQSSTKRLTCIVTALYIARLNPQAADDSLIKAGRERPPEADQSRSGLVTAKYFFSLGAGFLHRSDFSGAATIAECLVILSKASPWRQVVSHSVLSPLKTRVEEMELTSIFALMVLAGFPKLHREGSLVWVHSSDSPHLAVLTSVEGDGGTVVSPANREPKTVKLSQCEVEDTLRGCITPSELLSLLPLLQHCLQLSKKEDDNQVEATWILALSLKALLSLMKSQEAEEVVKSVLSSDLMVQISKLASRATGLSRKWLASDLEIVAIRNYQPRNSKDISVRNCVEKRDGEKEEPETENGHDVDRGSTEKSAKNIGPFREDPCLEGLSDDIQDMLTIMQEAFQCPLPTLRALFDASGSDVNKFIMSSEQYYDLESATLRPPNEILEAAAKWEVENSTEQEVKEIQDSLEDTGVTQLLPIPCSLSSLEAEPERADVTRKLKGSELMKEDTGQQGRESQVIGREDSFQLLQEQLKGEGVDRKELIKTQQATVVLYARHVLAALLSCWPGPPHPRLSTTQLGSLDEMQFFCLLDLLMKPLSQATSSQLLHSVIHCLEPTQLASLSVRAVEAMRKVSVGCERRQFQHLQECTLQKKGKLVIASASGLSVALSSSGLAAEIEVASNDDMSDHHQILSDRCKNLVHLIPGNTVHYRVKLEPAIETPSCTLTVTGTQMGRFTAGLMFLQQLVIEAEEEKEGKMLSCVPFTQIWLNLIVSACQLTGQERLKIVHLLLRLLAMMKDSSPGTDRLDLSALKPLWQLYTTLMKDYENKSKSQQVVAPHILRSLTELFLTVEELAEDWGVSQAMVIETLTKEGLGTWMEKGISNVAYLSLALGLQNEASSAFTDAKKAYVPPVGDGSKEDGEEEEEEREEVSGSSSSDESEPSDENSFESEES